jgi:hypothetical protein
MKVVITCFLPLCVRCRRAAWWRSLACRTDALLGTPLVPYIRLLREQELLPLSTLFSIGTNSPHYNEQDKTGIFYGESWALIHYLMLGDSGRQEQLHRFLQQVSRPNTAKSLENSIASHLTE